ncbi:unnamed protein product, partial [Effrenium voratum]
KSPPSRSRLDRMRHGFGTPKGTGSAFLWGSFAFLCAGDGTADCRRVGPCGESFGCSFQDWLEVEEGNATTRLCLREAYRCAVLDAQALAEGCRPGLLRVLLSGIDQALKRCEELIPCFVEVEHVYSQVLALWRDVPHWDRHWSLQSLRQKVEMRYDREMGIKDLRNVCIEWLRKAAQLEARVTWIGEPYIQERVRKEWLPSWISSCKEPSCQVVPDWVVCAMSSTSQLAQDLWVLSRLGHVRHGAFLEIGANHPETMSNTFLLEQAGWQGLCVEPFPRGDWSTRTAKLVIAAVGDGERQRFLLPGSVWGGLLQSMDASNLQRLERDYPREKLLMGEVETRSISDILKDWLPGAEQQVIHFLSIDTEGSELEILRSFPFDRYLPLAVAVEHLHMEPKKSETRAFMEEQGKLLPVGAGAVKDTFSTWRHLTMTCFC